MHTNRNKHPDQNSKQKKGDDVKWSAVMNIEHWTVCLKKETDTFISVPFHSLDVEGKNWLMIIGLLYKKEIIGRDRKK